MTTRDPRATTGPPLHAAPAADTPAAATDQPVYRVNWRRYRRTLRFAFWLIARIGFWEIFLRRLIGEQHLRRGRSRRMRRWAREFRGLATDMGGVMIKLGQFISSRVDLLPREVIEELASLQDEVPTVPVALMRQTFEQELGPPEDYFAAFTPTPVAAASLGQVHKAGLPDGTKVVVKIQRPGIETLVHTDLKALDVVAGWLMRFRFIARRADVPALLQEFSVVMWEELDYRQEADNVERFHTMFENNHGVYIPRLYRDFSTRRVLTLEDVTAIKITDYDRLEAAGINRRDVARRLVTTYLWMFFDQRFFHADPHPGNLFVYPLPPDSTAPLGHHQQGPPLQGRPFYLVFVDFGMVGRLTPEISVGLSEALRAFSTRDARRLVQAYQRLGVLLPGADEARIEAASRAVFDRIWGLSLSDMSSMHVSEMVDVGLEFRDLLFSMPFQVPQDFLYLGRAIGILIGMCTGLDPEFDPWHEMQSLINTMLGEESDGLPGFNLFNLTGRDLLRPETIRALLSEDSRNLLLDTGWDLTRRAIQLPALADDVLRRADRGELAVQLAPSPALETHLRRLERTQHRMGNAMLCAGLLIASAILYTAGEQTLALVGAGLAGLILLRGALAA
ncbi:MAG: AarF/ABC1/UbiB kinase family protein [Chloroflexi bacterium]|nr:AarF/ABC1/UbiB kinase family protein [Chloroflexota bacterium]